MSEFDLIRRFLAPLSTGHDGAFMLTDDAALLGTSTNIIAKDTLVEGIHFTKDMPLDIIARRALRTNLSDIAAMGAKPSAYLLSCVWPKETTEEQFSLFSRGLQQDQNEFKVSLIGGDTCVHNTESGLLTISITALGVAPKSGAIRRSGAVIGDDVYVSGTIGDSGLGLLIMMNTESMAPDDNAFLVNRYQLPTPRIALGGALAGIATSAIDVSDGLLADAGRLAFSSNIGIRMSLSQVPLSSAARNWSISQKDDTQANLKLASYGDDYELLFTAPKPSRRAVEMAGQLTKTSVMKIGTVCRGSGVSVIGDSNEEISVPQHGYDHFTR
ncbi:MAG: thiamine-phosphate kinase [Pseudomonadota bacterium]